MNPIKSIFGRIFSAPPPVETRGDLVKFIASEAAFVSQKCTIEYCRARAGLNWDKLFLESAFLDAMERCQWEGYAILLGGVAELVMVRLRRHVAAGNDRLSLVLTDVAAESLTLHGPPRYRRPDGTAAAGSADTVDDLGKRLSLALLSPPRAAHLIGGEGGEAVFSLLPVHPSLRRYDRELFVNSVRFTLARTAATMDDRLSPGLAAALLADPAPRIDAIRVEAGIEAGIEAG